MAPGVLESQALDYLQAHLRILSGFYGVLRPFDGVTPYRLEMQAKLAVEGAKNLYEFWGDRLAQTLAEEDGWVLNLASKEYSRAVAPHLPQGTELITCRFGIWKNSKLAERGTQCKNGPRRDGPLAGSKTRLPAGKTCPPFRGWATGLT